MVRTSVPESVLGDPPVAYRTDTTNEVPFVNGIKEPVDPPSGSAPPVDDRLLLTVGFR